MARHDSDLQGAVDATSVANDAHTTTDLHGYLVEQLAERGIETSDEGWVERTVEAIRANPNYMIEDEPSDFDADEHRRALRSTEMTTTPEEPLPEPEVVPSGDPAPIETEDPEPQADPLP